MPQPLGPMSEVMIPLLMSVETSKSAWKLPYQRESPRVSMAFGAALIRTSR